MHWQLFNFHMLLLMRSETNFWTSTIKTSEKPEVFFPHKLHSLWRIFFCQLLLCKIIFLFDPFYSSFSKVDFLSAMYRVIQVCSVLYVMMTTEWMVAQRSPMNRKLSELPLFLNYVSTTLTILKNHVKYPVER